MERLTDKEMEQLIEIQKNSQKQRGEGEIEKNKQRER